MRGQESPKSVQRRPKRLVLDWVRTKLLILMRQPADENVLAEHSKNYRKEEKIIQMIWYGDTTNSPYGIKRPHLNIRGESDMKAMGKKKRKLIKPLPHTNMTNTWQWKRYAPNSIDRRTDGRGTWIDIAASRRNIIKQMP